jgi:hypothetical protein
MHCRGLDDWTDGELFVSGLLVGLLMQYDKRQPGVIDIEPDRDAAGNFRPGVVVGVHGSTGLHQVRISIESMSSNVSC